MIIDAHEQLIYTYVLSSIPSLKELSLEALCDHIDVVRFDESLLSEFGDKILESLSKVRWI